MGACIKNEPKAEGEKTVMPENNNTKDSQVSKLSRNGHKIKNIIRIPSEGLT